MSKQVSTDLRSHQQRKINPDVAVEAGGGEMDAVITDVGGEPEDAHDDQPQPERHCPGLAVTGQLRGGEGTKRVFSDLFSICIRHSRNDPPCLIKLISRNQPPSTKIDTLNSIPSLFSYF